MYMCVAPDLVGAVKAGEEALARGFESLKEETISADRAWIARAKQPAKQHPFVASNYKRWLLANRLCLTEDGAIIAGPRPFWSYSWPRDSSLLVGAFAAAGFIEEARRMVKWQLDNTPPSRIHDARYFTDRTPMLLDNRPRQGDNPGFIAWSAAFVCEAQWDDGFARSVESQVYALADMLVEYRDDETGLPMPEADYWEGAIAESISIAVSAAGGLRAVAKFARRLGDEDRATRYQARASEIKAAAEKHLWNPDGGYFMQSVKPLNTLTDVAACWGAYPFKVWNGSEEIITQGVQHVKADRWDAQAGGMLVGKGTSSESLWFYHSAILLMGAAAVGDLATETEILESLAKNVSPQGLVPEQIGRANGHLWGCAYLSTVQGCLLLYAYMGG